MYTLEIVLRARYRIVQMAYHGGTQNGYRAQMVRKFPTTMHLPHVQFRLDEEASSNHLLHELTFVPFRGTSITFELNRDR